MKTFVEIKDQETNIKHIVKITFSENGIEITPEGYGCGEYPEAGPIYIEYINNIPKISIWADFNNYDPTHVINLANAKTDDIGFSY